MSDTKTYVLSWNAVSNKIISYASKEVAERQGVYAYSEIEASSIKEAKETYMDYYLHNKMGSND